jgi:4-amino-4-deoxy-L-arabinose transferase-like glycosyltransferase
MLLPAVEAAGFRFTGYETRLLDVQSWLFVVAFAAAYVRLVVPRVGRAWLAWGVLLTLLIAPSLADQLASAEADVPLAAFFASAGLAAYLFLVEGGRAWAVLCGVLAAGAAATKIEGALFVVALAVAALVVARGRAVPLGLAAVAGLAAAMVPWRLWLAAHDVPNQASLGRLTDVGFLADHAGRVPYAAAYVAGRFVDPRAWLLLVPLCAVATAVGRRSGAAAGAAFTMGVVALCLLALLLAYWTTPFELHAHLATSARRVITGPLLFWAAVTPLLADKRLTKPGYPGRP